MEKYRLVQELKVDEVSTRPPLPASPTQPPNMADVAAACPQRNPAITQSRPHASDTATTSTGTVSSSEFPEVRITQQGKPRNYISYAMGLLVRYKSHYGLQL